MHWWCMYGLHIYNGKTLLSLISKMTPQGLASLMTTGTHQMLAIMCTFGLVLSLSIGALMLIHMVMP